MLQGGGERKQTAAADRTLARLLAVIDLALNHRLAHGAHSSREKFFYIIIIAGFKEVTVWKLIAKLRSSIINHDH